MKKVFHIFFGLLLLLAATAARAQYNYITNNGTITITGYTGSGGFVTIPSNINSLTITAIASNAFANIFNLNRIVIPGSVTNIGDDAFGGCIDLTMANIGNGVLSIGNYAFDSCNALATVGATPGGFTLPNSVTSIGTGAFADTQLNGATIPSGVTNLGGNPFSACSGITSIGVATNNPAYTNVNGIVFNKSLTALIAYPPGKAGSSYAISNNITSIGTDAFNECDNLTNVTIPASIASIAGAPFQNCNNLLGINVDTNNSAYSSVNGVLFNNPQTELIEYPQADPASSYTIPSNVLAIGDSAFEGSHFSAVTIPNSVTSVGTSVFEGCLNLTNVIIPDSVTNLGDEAFFSCRNLTNVTISDSLTTLGFAVFAFTGLTSSTIPGNITGIGIAAYEGSDLTSLSIPNSITTESRINE